MCKRGLVLLLLTASLAAQQATEPAEPPRRSKPPALRELRDLAYYSGPDADASKHKLDLFLPSEAKKVPVVMWIHGGGWVWGDRWMYPQVGRRFAEAGIGFAAISYRLSPKVQHPAHAQDCARAFAWLHTHVAEHGGDPDRLFIAGQSAGGHLAALLACDPQFLKDAGVPSGALKGAIPMSGVYRIPALPADTKGLGFIFPRAFGSSAEVCEAASPIAHVGTLTCPMLVITETQDFGVIRQNMELLRAAAQKAGVSDIRFMDAEQRNHITIVTSLARRGDEAVRELMVDFVRQRCQALDAKK
jgi:acetyl esterase/lipase